MFLVRPLGGLFRSWLYLVARGTGVQELPLQAPDKFSGRATFRSLLSLFLLVFPPLARAEADTSGTLRLGDLFQSTGPAPVSRRVPGTRLGRSMIVVPDTSTWKIPPATPEAAPTLPFFEGMSNIPKIPMLIQERDRHDRHATEAAFRAGGRVPGEELAPGMALLSVENSFERLRSEYRLIPVTETGAPPREPLVVLQAPGSSDRFAIPEGLWRVERDLWLDGDLLHKAREFYPEQRFVSRTRYEFQGAEADESVVIRRDLDFTTK